MQADDETPDRRSFQYIIVTIEDEAIQWISKAYTQRGAERSAEYAHKLSPSGVVKVISVQEILDWQKSGVSELEALYKL